MRRGNVNNVIYTRFRGFYCVFIVLVIPVIVQAGDIYIDQRTGSDMNSGLDWAHAKATIQAGLDASDTIPLPDTEFFHAHGGSVGPFLIVGPDNLGDCLAFFCCHNSLLII